MARSDRVSVTGFRDVSGSRADTEIALLASGLGRRFPANTRCLNELACFYGRLDMAKITKTHQRALATMKRVCFTWPSDNIFKTLKQGQKVCRDLVSIGYAVAETDEYGTQDVLTAEGREYIKWEMEWKPT